MATGPYKLAHHRFSGTPRQIGAGYGEAFAAAIHGFYRQEVTPRLTGRNAALVAAAKRASTRWTPDALAMLNGVAMGAKLDAVDAMQLALHEELVHTKHCTAVVGPRIVAQNWDWCPSLYAWPGIVTLKPRGKLATLTYHYPGLWACCGVNGAGLALMWTGSAYYPTVAPAAGVPTYLLISELMQQRDVEGALRLLGAVPRAGSFIFLIADQHGDAAIVEATPGTMVVRGVATAAARANHFQEPEMQRVSRQKLPAEHVYNTGARFAAAAAGLGTKALTTATAKKILTTAPVYRREATSFTLDSLIADCRARTLMVRRGDARQWITFTL